MGSRGSSSGSDNGLGGGGGNDGATVTNERDLISQREDGKQNEVDTVMTALRGMNDEYGLQISNVQTGKIDPPNVMAAYSEAEDSVIVNESYFNAARTDASYDYCVDQKYHPGRGNKSGLEAVAAHELGHALNAKAAADSGRSMEDVAKEIVINGSKAAGGKSKKVAAGISGYAEKNNKECIAEAVADVYCNGKNANAGSIAIVNELKKYLK